jgi:lipopolysaccharide heptosyltransferase II
MMSPEAMRWIDKYIGNLLITLLAIFRRRHTPDRSLTVKTIAVSKYLGIGSLLMATPLLQHLKTTFPSARLVVTTLRKNVPLLQLLPFVDQVVSIDGRNLATFALSTLRALRTLRASRIDLWFDLEFFARYSAIVSFLAGAPIRVGFTAPRNPRWKLLTHPVEFSNRQHVSVSFLDQARTLGLMASLPDDPAPQIMRLEPPDVGIQEALGLLRSRRIREYVLFNATAGEAIGRERQWPAAKWRELARQVVAQLNLDVVFTAEKSKAHEVESILAHNHSPHVHNLAGATTFHAFIALIAMARACVTIDSAALHIAQSVGTPTVSLHGPEPPLVHAYPSPRNRAIYKGLSGGPCPCFNLFENKRTLCKYDAQCMRNIEVEEVLQALREVLVPEPPVGLPGAR